jgi:hypothetical protein
MATLPPEMILSSDAAALAGRAAPAALISTWDALHGQSAQLALLARLAPEPAQGNVTLEAALAESQPWQRSLVAQGMDDIAAMLDTGLMALSTLSHRGQDTAAPALTLWREFHAARAALLGVLGSNAAA